MQQAVFFMFFFVMVFMLMSGLLTPIESMPQWAQYVTYVLPPRYFISIMRSVFMKGATFYDMRFNFLALTGLAIIMNLGAALSYRKRS